MKRYRDIAGDGGSDVAGQVGAQLARLRRRLEPIRFSVAVVSGKGGVGKSTIAGGLACAFALDGWRVAHGAGGRGNVRDAGPCGVAT